MEKTGILCVGLLIGFLFVGACNPDDGSDPDKKDTIDNKQIHADSVRLIQGGFTKDLRDSITLYLNNLRLKGCLCHRIEDPDYLDFYEPVGMVEWDSIIEIATLRHSLDMAKHYFMGHDGTDGSKPRDRLLEAGIVGQFLAWENAAGPMHTPKFEDAFNAWQGSKTGHCQSLMNPKNKKFALSRGRHHKTGHYFWTLVFVD